MARAQINLLAMLDEWAKYAEDGDVPAPVLPHKPTPKDVEIITRRMYEKTKQRRKLGMMARSIVQKSFGGERYLREHEQMLWIGKATYEMLGLEKRVPPPRNPARLLSLRRRSMREQHTDTASSHVVDPQLEKMQHPRRPYAVRHQSTATSFSSVYADQPWGSSTYSNSVWEHEEWDRDPDTPGTSFKYPSSEKSEETRPLQNLPVTRPPKAQSRVSGGPVPVSPIARGKRVVSHQEHGYGAFDVEGNFKNEKVAPKMDARRAVLMRQSLATPDSARSSVVRTRSHLHEMEIAEYGKVEGRL
jgi:hypothetical protein